MYSIRIVKTGGEFIDVVTDRLPRCSMDEGNDTLLLETSPDYELVYYGKLSSVVEIIATNVLEEANAIHTRT